jgi:Lsr2
MAMRMSVVTSDDLDGTSDAETVTFGLNGTVYEIDLAAKNRAKLEKALAPFIAAGRRVSARSRRPASRRASGPDNAAIRAWAKSEGLKVSERGRISADIISQYEARR